MRVPQILVLATAGGLALSIPLQLPIQPQRPKLSKVEYVLPESIPQTSLAQHSVVSTTIFETSLQKIAYTPLFQPPLSTSGRYVVDANNTRFKLASINWYGGSDESFIPSGLDIQHRSAIAHTIRQLGFNSVRLPYSDEMVYTNPIIPSSLLAANADLYSEKSPDVRALDVYHAVINALTEVGIAVIPNNHITSTGWCSGTNPCNSAWYNDQLSPLCRVQQTEESWIANWETIMEPHIHNPLVIGADLRNEVGGLWGTMSWKKWARAAELAGDRLLRMNPDWLLFVSGTGSGNFLHEVKNRPVELVVPNKVVYEAHVYSWSGWGSWLGSYGTRSYDSFSKSMRENWGYLLEEALAPVWIGEFGIGDESGSADQKYWGYLLKYLKETDVDWGYWALNPREPKDHVREGYGLLGDDWETAVVDYRMKDLLGIMPQSA